MSILARNVVAAGYGGDMSDDLCDELLDDMVFVGNKVKCRKIEMMMPRLNKIVEKEMNAMGNV